MRTISINLADVDSNLYFDSVVREGEHNATQLSITLSEEFIGYTYKLSFKLNNNSTYLTADLVPVDNVITYSITNALTFEDGTLKCELQAYTDDSYLAKSAIFPLQVRPALEGIPIELPADYETYVKVVEHYMDKDIYDPTGKQKDVYSMDNMVEGANTKIMTADERNKLAILTGGTSSVDYVQFDTTPADGQEYDAGKLQWNPTAGTLAVGIGVEGVLLEMNQATHIRAKNVSGNTLTVGQVVYIKGSDGVNVLVDLADANGTEAQSYAVGITAVEPVLNGEIGYFLTSGILHNVDTLAFAEGDPLWLSNTNGLPTNVMPPLPANPVFLGWCIKQAGASDGMIYINVTRYPTASKVPLLDAGDYYVGNSAEDVLQEIGAKIKTSYGEIYVYNGNTPQSIPNGTTYTKITPFMANGEYLNCTPEASNQRIIIDRNGKYRVTSTFSSMVSVNNTVLDTALFKNGIEVQKAHITRISSSSSPSAGSMTCVLTCSIGDILDVRVKHDKGTPVNLTVMNGNLNVTKIVG